MTVSLVLVLHVQLLLGIEPVVVHHCPLPSGIGAAERLQACIDGAPAGSILEIPPGQYELDRQVVIGRPLTLRTAGVSSRVPLCRSDPARCAVLAASAGFGEANGFLRLESTTDVTLAHVILDGNRGARTASAAAQACQAGNNRLGFNATAHECTRCRLHDVVSRNALCGTAFEWTGALATIRQSTFHDNGDPSNRLMWADGLTALYAPGSTIVDNLFADNSDIGLIVGHGARALIARNHIVQLEQSAFAGLMLDNFNSADLRVRGDFRQAVVTANVIDCGTHRCGFGIQLGPHPWYDSPNIVGGEVIGNEVSGAGVGINIDGAGTRDFPVVVYANTIRRVAVDVAMLFPLCVRVHEGSLMDIAGDSVVDRRGDKVVPARRRDWHDC